MAKDRSDPELDRELADLPPELRWREWMRRIEAVLFASASPVPREAPLTSATFPSTRPDRAAVAIVSPLSPSARA